MGLAHRQEQAAQVIAVVELFPCGPKKSPGDMPGPVNAASFSGGEHAESQASLPSCPLSSLTFVRAARENDSRALRGRILAELVTAVSARSRFRSVTVASSATGVPEGEGDCCENIPRQGDQFAPRRQFRPA